MTSIQMEAQPHFRRFSFPAGSFGLGSAEREECSLTLAGACLGPLKCCGKGGWGAPFAVPRSPVVHIASVKGELGSGDLNT